MKFFEKLVKWNSALAIPIPVAFGLTGLIAAGSIYSYRGAVQQIEYEQRVRPICQRVMQKFDTNKDGFINPEEGIKMSRAVGYDRILPSPNLMFQLKPGSHVDESAYLEINSAGSYGTVSGFASGEEHPSFNEKFAFPLSKLEKISKE